MPTTRSAAKQRTKAEDEGTSSKSKAQKSSTEVVENTEANKQKTQKPTPGKATAKRGKHSDEPVLPSKKQKQQHLSSEDAGHLEKPIIINRSPVLQLWGATVAQFLHPDLSWSACLSVGNAISALCAISKGRAIGKIEAKDGEESEQRKEEKRKAKEGTQEISLMGFSLHLKNNAVILGGHEKTFSEDALKKKFGEENYETVKKSMSDGVDSWADAKEELDQKAFHMYEKFRPNVASGQQGWGRKGELNLSELTSIVKRQPD